MTTVRKHIQKRLDAAVATLAAKKLEEVADFAEYLNSREEWEATRELLLDPGMRKDVEKGRAQAANGAGRSWREVQRRVRS